MLNWILGLIHIKLTLHHHKNMTNMKIVSMETMLQILIQDKSKTELSTLDTEVTKFQPIKPTIFSYYYQGFSISKYLHNNKNYRN